MQNNDVFIEAEKILKNLCKESVLIGKFEIGFSSEEYGIIIHYCHGTVIFKKLFNCNISSIDQVEIYCKREFIDFCFNIIACTIGEN